MFLFSLLSDYVLAMSSKPKVVIIGAGISGLSAASKLYKSGQVEVCVLEASERVGGRVHTGKIGDNTVEFGAAWIHGTVDNPIFDLACDLQFILKSDRDKKWLSEDTLEKPQSFATTHLQLRIDDQMIEEVWDVFKNLISETEDMPEMKNITKYTKMSVGDYLHQGFQSYLDSCTSDTATTKKLKTNLFSFFTERECTDMGCNSLYDLNLVFFGEYVQLDGSNSCPIPSGYDRIAKALAAGLPSGCVHFQHEVTKINWVASSESDEPQSSYHPVKILCGNGKTFDADHVIITVSLGILKEKHSTLFRPSLPTDKITAIQDLGFGYVGKIFLEFERRFWPSDEYSLPLFREDKENLKNKAETANCPWVQRLYSWYTTRPGANVLFSFFRGNESLQIESISPQEVGKQCLEAIKSCTNLESLPPIVNVERTQWGTNPWTRGSYSFVSKAASGSDFDTLASPLPCKSAGREGIPALQLMFAGEATHRYFYGTVHGAYLTGVREADRLLKHLSDCRI